MHGNGTFSFLWRNIIPYALKKGWRCLAPDLIGQGDSGLMPSNSYKYTDHYKYIEAWFDAMNLPDKIVLVLHDWGGALGFNWAEDVPTPLGLIPMEDGTYSVLYTAKKREQFWAIGVSRVRNVQRTSKQH